MHDHAVELRCSVCREVIGYVPDSLLLTEGDLITCTTPMCQALVAAVPVAKARRAVKSPDV